MTAPEGLRERKKRLTRRRISDTATAMFLERGFDGVTVVEVARASEVSEKTVYNYFPTKESLLLDRFDATMTTLGAALTEPGAAPIEATLTVLAAELDGLTSWLAGQDDPVATGRQLHRFRMLIESTASLRAHQRDMLDRLTAMAASALAGRTGAPPDGPEPQIAAIALLGLWQIQSRALGRALDTGLPVDRLRETVDAQVRTAARVIEAGLGRF